MTLPGVNINELDNQLGVLSASGGGKLLAVVGATSKGPLNLPSSFARVKDIVATFGTGPAVEAAAYYIERYQRPVLMVRVNASADAAVSTVSHVALGTSVVTVDTSPEPVDDYELALQILTDGTVGTTGITYRTSLDGGRTWSGTYALGTATKADFPDAGVKFAFGTGTVKANDMHTATATAATWSSSDLHDALAPLGTTLVQWELVLIVGTIDATSFDVAEQVTSFTNGAHWWIGSPRIPNPGETEAAYLTALTALSAAKSSTWPSLYAGACKLTSAISGRAYRRPLAWATAARQAAVAEHINIADVGLGALPGCSIRDANGNPDEHDESINPGLDDLRYGTARTWPRRSGVYVTLPRIFAPSGSDFEIAPNRRVMNLAHEVLYDYLVTRIHRPILVSRKTGRILTAEATEIELAANAVLAAALLATPKASGATFTLSRTDNLLSVPKLTCGAKILPLAYPRWIDLDLSFENPALQLQAV